MKGRKLTLDEVLRLDDGTKVWVEELSEVDEPNEWSFSKLETPPKVNIGSCVIQSSFIKDMATEICNLRGIDLTDDNIDKIMKEFS